MLHSLCRRAFMRRAMAGALFVGGGLLPALPAAAANQKAQEIADHFATITTMTGEFIQFGPKGEQTGGKFFLERPGRIRFNYEAPSPMRVISDGKYVVIGNRKLRTWSIYPLSKTPLKLLLDKTIDLGGQMVRKVSESDDLVTIVLGDKSIFGDSSITMMFDPATNDLRQWTITDNRGQETTVMIFNTQTGVAFGPKVFEVPYDQVHKMKGSR